MLVSHTYLLTYLLTYSLTVCCLSHRYSHNKHTHNYNKQSFLCLSCWFISRGFQAQKLKANRSSRQTTNKQTVANFFARHVNLSPKLPSQTALRRSSNSRHDPTDHALVETRETQEYECYSLSSMSSDKCTVMIHKFVKLMQLAIGQELVVRKVICLFVCLSALKLFKNWDILSRCVFCTILTICYLVFYFKQIQQTNLLLGIFTWAFNTQTTLLLYYTRYEIWAFKVFNWTKVRRRNDISTFGDFACSLIELNFATNLSQQQQTSFFKYVVY